MFLFMLDEALKILLAQQRMKGLQEQSFLFSDYTIYKYTKNKLASAACTMYQTLVFSLNPYFGTFLCLLKYYVEH